MLSNNSRRCKAVLSKFRRAWVMYLDNGECVYCGEPNSNTLDHVIPVSLTPYAPKRVVNAFHNLVTACLPCNERKGSRVGVMKPKYGRFARYDFLTMEQS